MISGFACRRPHHGPKNFRRGESNAPNRADITHIQQIKNGRWVLVKEGLMF